MNYIDEIRKTLGFERYETFTIEDVDSNPYMFTEDEFCDCDGDVRSHVLGELLTGDVEIKRPPWKPKDGDRVYYITPQGLVSAVIFSTDINSHLVMWKSSEFFETPMLAQDSRFAKVEKYTEIRKELES